MARAGRLGDELELAVLGDERRQPAQPPFLLERGQVAPAAVVERRARGPDRALHVRRRPGGRGGDLLAGGGIDHRHGAAVERRHDLAVDDVAEQRPVELARGGSRDRIRGGVGQDAHGQGSRSRRSPRASPPELTLLRFRLCPVEAPVKHNDVTSVAEFLDRVG